MPSLILFATSGLCAPYRITTGCANPYRGWVNKEVPCSKRDLIEKFIQENLPVITDSDTIPQEFDKFWTEEQQKAFETFVKEEQLSSEKTQKLIEDYLYAEREPLRDQLLDLIEGEKPSVLKRKSIGDRLLSKVVDFVETFINGMER